jgi:biotin transport system substrate-specific component
VSRYSLSLGKPTLADRLLGRGLAIDAVLILAGVAVTAIAAQAATPAWPIQTTGQGLAVLVVGMALGSVRGALSMALYVLVGVLGLPVFSNSSAGPETITGPAGGYVLGLIVAAGLVGWVAEKGLDRTFLRAAASASAGTAVILVIGVTWLSVVNELSPSEAMVQGVLPVAVASVAKVLIAAAINTATWSALSRMEVRDARRTQADG